MCITVVLFQFSVNVTVMALFQPLMSDRFGWSSSDFSALQSFMSFLGFFVTSSMSALSKNRIITAQRQNKIGGLFFFIAVGLFVIPPLSEYRLVAAQIFSFIAQIIFQCAPLYGQIITKHHLTSVQLSILASMIAVGQAIGCWAAPFFLPDAGTLLFTVVFIPIMIGLLLITLLVWKYDPDGRCRAAEAKKMKKNQQPAAFAEEAPSTPRNHKNRTEPPPLRSSPKINVLEEYEKSPSLLKPVPDLPGVRRDSKGARAATNNDENAMP